MPFCSITICFCIFYLQSTKILLVPRIKNFFDRTESNELKSRFLLFVLLFFFPLFLGGKRKRNYQSRGQKSCLSARSFKYIQKKRNTKVHKILGKKLSRRKAVTFTHHILVNLLVKCFPSLKFSMSNCQSCQRRLLTNFSVYLQFYYKQGQKLSIRT